MSETPGPPTVEAATLRFVRAWGALAHAWGISRTMGETHAYLFASAEPRCTDDLMAALGLSRGSVNTNLRELEQWRLARRVHKSGDRKDYYEAEGDPWVVCWTLLDERKRREVDPILEVLGECLRAAPTPDNPAAEQYRERLGSLLELLRELSVLYERLRPLLAEGGPELLRSVLGE
jgi:DNA-binding transcriptional regulator GbsR (MarR family)